MKDGNRNLRILLLVKVIYKFEKCFLLENNLKFLLLKLKLFFFLDYLFEWGIILGIDKEYFIRIILDRVNGYMLEK